MRSSIAPDALHTWNVNAATCVFGASVSDTAPLVYRDRESDSERDLQAVLPVRALSVSGTWATN